MNAVAMLSPQGIIAAGKGGAYRGNGADDDAAMREMLSFKPRSLLYGPRYTLLDFRQSYYDCTQHDRKGYDFDCRVIAPGGQWGANAGLITSRKAGFDVPMRARRPSAPVRLAKVIVDGFTAMVFGENRFPKLRVEGDDQTQDFVQAVVRSGRLPLQMVRARNIAGATGTVGLSWCFYEGLPRFEVHNPKNLFVHKWKDRTALVPEWVSEVYTFTKTQWDGKQMARIHYWFRRDWTPEGDVAFVPVPYKPGEEPTWIVDEEKTAWHDDGCCHLEWIQNLPTDEADGTPDYEGLYDQFDTLDVLSSVLARGAVINCDPTLILKMDPDMLERAGVKKGSDNALAVGEAGDAHYMELAGTSIAAGSALADSMRKGILETAQCVVLDPDKAAANGVSSVTMKLAYAPMTAKSDIIREQFGTALERMLENMIKVARTRASVKVPVEDAITGEVMESTVALALPPRVEERPKLDDMGVPVLDDDGKPEVEVIRTPRTPGDGGDVTLVWPAYFQATSQDQTNISNTLSVATGGKAILSKETAIELMAQVFNMDPEEEKLRVEAGSQKEKAEQAEMFPPTGGGPDDPGGEEGGKPPPFGGKGGGKPFGGPPGGGGKPPPFGGKGGGFGKPGGAAGNEKAPPPKGGPPAGA